MGKTIQNLDNFQLGCIVCVVGGDLYAMSFTSIALLVHHRYVLEKNSEWQLIVIVVVVGSLWDILMTFSGLVYYADSGFLGIPIWLICLWWKLIFVSSGILHYHPGLFVQNMVFDARP